MPEPLVKQKEKEIQLVVFNLGDKEFGLEITSVVEVSRMLEVTRIPQAPGFIEGVINLRGEIVPVIDLAGEFGTAKTREYAKDSRIIVAESGGETAGLVVDKVPEVLRILEKDNLPAPEMIQKKLKNDYLKGVAKIGNRLIVVLDIDRILQHEQLEAAGKLNKGREAA